MPAGFRPVNTATSAKMEEAHEDSSPTTPTPANTKFGTQRPLPNSPFPQAVQVPERIDEDPSQPSQKSPGNSEDVDVDMDSSDAEGHGPSDRDSPNADASGSKKKKSSQRFYCTDYPPCSLSFTRSEHLARHIRKHTGERPFVCHCSRRFSRLDNLRQHAQTVHVNEDIPQSSLAATGTRYQRAIRTDRVHSRTGPRSRGGPMGMPGRGHSKSLSTSNIGSLSSAFRPRDDIRQRPAALVIGPDPHTRQPVDHYGPGGGTGGEVPYSYRQTSPSDFSTPTSTTFSNTGPSSPRWGSGIGSPASSHSRSHSMYAGSKTPGRRLSVPSSANPFQSPHGSSYGWPSYGGTAPSNQDVFSPGPSVAASPTSSVFSRRDSTSNADEAWRRRTWHPDSHNFQNGYASGGANNGSTPQFINSAGGAIPPPIPSQQQQQQQQQRPGSGITLPGIETFDQPPPPRRDPSPRMTDNDAGRYPPLQPIAEISRHDPDDSRDLDRSLPGGMTRLDIRTRNPTPPRSGPNAWAHSSSKLPSSEVLEPTRGYGPPPVVRFHEPAASIDASRVNGPPGPRRSPPGAHRSYHMHTASAPSLPYYRESSRRHGWAQGPPPPTYEEGPPPVRNPRVERMVHPNISEWKPVMVPSPETSSIEPGNARERDIHGGLDALAAAATRNQIINRDSRVLGS